jgi:elongator complex protein 3
MLKNLWLRDINHPSLINWEKTKRRWATELNMMPKSSDLASAYQELVAADEIKFDAQILDGLMVKKVRTQSGVAPFAVMMKPYPCPGRCVFCVEEKGLPKSYMADEPASARALSHNFDPVEQIKSRLLQMKLTGHSPQKLQIIVVGGTFSAYENSYKIWFLKGIFDACNGFIAKDIQEAHQANENAAHRVVGLSVETRPDWINDEEIKLLRMCGVTKVQLGVQSLSEEINSKSARGHDLEAVIRATRQLRNAGFKINYHFMLNLPGSSPEKDTSMFGQLFEDANYRPDSLKIYPCIVIPNTPLYNLYKKGLFKSYEPDVLAETLVNIKMLVPHYCRIDRLARDITRNYTASGNLRTNLREMVSKKMAERNLICKCIRCREVKNISVIPTKDLIIDNYKYEAAGGDEYLLTFSDQGLLLALLRLRVPHEKDRKEPLFLELSNASIIRELQVYGRQAQIKSEPKKTIQHHSLGLQLMLEAEKVSKSLKLNKVAVISGIGVRSYYKKLGYALEGSYMIKHLN